MDTPTSAAQSVTFDFNCYRFNGKGNRPVLVTTPREADFIRSRYSVGESSLELATQRVLQWSKKNGFGIIAKKPYPSSEVGKYWLEFRLGGITL
jgi:hypothetical protein